MKNSRSLILAVVLFCALQPFYAVSLAYRFLEYHGHMSPSNGLKFRA